MAAGRQYNRGQLDATMANHAQQLAGLLVQANEFKAYLDNLQDADLTTLGYSPAEITDVRAAYTDLGILIGVIAGQVPLSKNGQPVTTDFRAVFRRLGGYAF